jgi:hypothetical protein
MRFLCIRLQTERVCSLRVERDTTFQEKNMKKLALISAAAALLAFSVGTASANSMKLAQADVSVRIGTPGVGVYVGDNDRRYYRHRHYRRHHAQCRTVTVRERRGGTVYVRKVRRC